MTSQQEDGNHRDDNVICTNAVYHEYDVMYIKHPENLQHRSTSCLSMQFI